MKKGINQKVSIAVGAMAVFIIVCLGSFFFAYASGTADFTLEVVPTSPEDIFTSFEILDGSTMLVKVVYINNDSAQISVNGSITKSEDIEMSTVAKLVNGGNVENVELDTENKFSNDFDAIPGDIYLYSVVFDGLDEYPSGKWDARRIEIRKRPTLSMENSKSISGWDQLQPVSFSCNVNDYANVYTIKDGQKELKLQVGYTDAALSDDATDADIISALIEHKEAKDINNQFNYPMTSLEDKTLTVVLYYDGVIFDKKTIAIDTNGLTIPSFTVKDRSGLALTDSEIRKGVNENSVTFRAIIGNDETEYSYFFGPEYPYKVVLTDSDSHSSAFTYWYTNGYGAQRTYTMEVSIDGISLPISKDGLHYTVDLYRKLPNGTYFKIGDSIPITIKDKIPELVWKDGIVTPVSEGTDKILLPGGSSFKASFKEYYHGDKIYSTSAPIAEEDYDSTNWSEQTSYATKNESGIIMEISENDMNNHVGETMYFYLVRGNGDQQKVYALGQWEIGYKSIEKHWYQIPEAYKTVFETGSPAKLTSYARQEVGETTCIATIKGYYTNGMDQDQVFWTAADLSAADLYTYASNSATPVTDVIYYYGDSRCFTANIQGLAFDDIDTEKLYHFYIRRPRTVGSDAVYTVIPLADITLMKDHYPVLDNATVEVGEEEWIDGVKRFKTTINIETSDEDTGIKSVTVLYTKKHAGWDEKDFELFSDSNNFGQQYSSGSKLFYLSEEERQSCYVKIDDWTGNIRYFYDIFKIMPEVSIEFPSGMSSTYDGTAYTALSLNQEIVITASRCDEAGLSLAEATGTSLKSITVSVNDTILESKSYEEGINQDSFTVNLNDSRIEKPDDGLYKIRVTVNNTAKNKNSAEALFVYDDSNPSITSVKIGGNNAPLLDFGDKYVYFFNSPKDIEVTAEDGKYGAGLKSIDYYWLDSDGTKKTGSESFTEKQSANITVSRNDSYKSGFYVTATDIAGNKIMEDGKVKYYTIGGIIVDTPENHSLQNHTSISADATSAKDAKGNPLYSSSFNAVLNVSDSFSGIKSVEWRVNNGDSSQAQSGSMTVSDGVISGDSWGVNGREKNILTDVSKKITIGGNGDNMSIYLKMTDNAGNTSEKTYEFSIDSVKPVLTVNLEAATGDPEFKNYYSQKMKATVTVKDRYFDESSFSIVNTSGNKGTLSAWTEKLDKNNPDNNTYTATVTFTADDRYALSFTCKDKAGNSSDKANIPEFVIDTKTPEVTVTFEGNKSSSGFYAEERKATIFVKDVNFEASRVAIAGALAGQGYELSAWTKKDDGYSAVMTLKKDGTYNFSVTATDKAGNKGNLVNIPSFVLDTKKPEITIEGVKDGSSNRGKVAPVIKIDDLNPDKNTVIIELIGAKQGKIDISEWYKMSEDGLEIDFNDFLNTKDSDDLYTLKVTVKDKAGNETVKTVKFSVNRFGSIYYLSEDFQKISEKYVKKVSGIEITEINPDKISKKNVVIILTVNGNPKTLIEDVDYTISAEESEGEWKTYKYIFADSLFTQDGSYVITVTTEDEAGNINNNVEKETEIKFGVDATAPIVAALDFEENTFYSENGKEMSITVKDNILLDEVKIYVDNIETEYTVSEEVYTFRINESNRPQSVKIVAKDKAGNQTMEVYDGILVSGNFFIRLLHNKLLLIGLIGGGALLIIGGTFLGFKKFGK